MGDITTQYHPEVVRYVRLNSHNPGNVTYSEENLNAAKADLSHFYTTLREYDELLAVDLSMFYQPSEYLARFQVAMKGDGNTPEALSAMLDLTHEQKTHVENELTGEAIKLALELKSMGKALGLLQQKPASEVTLCL